MLDIAKLKKVSVMSRRMYLINYIANKTGTDVYYLFGLESLNKTHARLLVFFRTSRILITIIANAFIIK